MNTTTQTTLLDLDAMMEQTLDAIPEAPDYSNPPAGEYRIVCKDSKIDSYKNKEGTEVQRLKNTYAILETKSTAAGELPVPDGTLFTETFQATEMGLGYYKARVKGIMNAADLNGVSLRDLMDSVKGAEFDCRITIKKTPKDKANPNGEQYENLNIRVIPPAA